MSQIRTFVVMDIETTGLPKFENNGTKITEICLMAASRKDIRNAGYGNLPRVRKFSTIINPLKPITPGAAAISCITTKLVKNAPTFEQVFSDIEDFLNNLPPPVCLVAHNGHRFDYKIFLAECNDIQVLEPIVLCVDSLDAFDAENNMSFAITDIYSRFFDDDEMVHRAEADCRMLMKCIVAAESKGGRFMEWADENSTYLHEVEPLERCSNEDEYEY